MDELLTPLQMDQADKLTIESGVPGIELMETAGSAVATIIRRKFPAVQSVLVLCGTGNNAGDGFVAARILLLSGLRVKLWCASDFNRLNGDAASAQRAMPDEIITVDNPDPDHYELIIDALFGAGLDRDITGTIANMITAVNTSQRPVIAIDLPSGVDGATGQIRGVAIKASASVTFFRKKPGHVLLPGRTLCGKTYLSQIGILADTIAKTGFEAWINQPELWLPALPRYAIEGHKYSRGHVVVVSGPLVMSGAARLAAAGALRCGAGLVTIAGSHDTIAANAAQLTSIMQYEMKSAAELTSLLDDKRFNCVVVGPGLAPGSQTRALVLAALKKERSLVIDAGALTAFKGKQEVLFSALAASASTTVLTPHEGEFAKLFPGQIDIQSKISQAKLAAKIAGATIVLKGADTVVAAPDGRACVAQNAPPWLATAGSGDVLSGIIGGFLAQGMAAFEAAAAAVWLHGDAANRFGPPLVSSDLDQALRQSLAAMFARQQTTAL